MSARQLIPEPKRWGKRNLWDRWQVDAWFADLFDRPKPPKPEKIELVTAEEFAELLRITPRALKERLREARQAAAETVDEAPDQASEAA
jgi:hypothetical protein